MGARVLWQPRHRESRRAGRLRAPRGRIVAERARSGQQRRSRMRRRHRASPPLPAPQAQAARTAGELPRLQQLAALPATSRYVCSRRIATAATDSERIGVCGSVRLLRLVKHAERTGLRRVPGINSHAAVPRALHPGAVCGSGARESGA